MKIFDPSRLEPVLGELYEAALDANLWRPALHSLANALNADGAVMFCAAFMNQGGIHYSTGSDEAFEWLAADGSQLHNPRPSRALRFGVGRAVTETDLFSDWELRNTPFNAGVSARGVYWEAGGIFGNIDGVPLFLTSHRRSGQERFGAAELRAIEAVFPHIERAVQLALRLQAAEVSGMLSAFDTANCGAMLLDGRGAVIQLNARAEAVIGDGLELRDRRLEASHAPSNIALRHLIADIVQSVSPIGNGIAALPAAIHRQLGRHSLCTAYRCAGKPMTSSSVQGPLF